MSTPTFSSSQKYCSKSTYLVLKKNLSIININNDLRQTTYPEKEFSINSYSCNDDQTDGTLGISSKEGFESGREYLQYFTSVGETIDEKLTTNRPLQKSSYIYIHFSIEKRESVYSI